MIDLPAWLRGDGDGFESISEDPVLEECDEKRFSSGDKKSATTSSNRKSPSSRPLPDVRDAAPSTPLLMSKIKSPEKGNYVEAEMDELDECCFCPLDPILWWFALFTVVTSAIALAGMLLNVVYIAKHSDSLDIRSIMLRVYAAVFCGGIVLIETDWRFILSRLRIMDVWLIRGVFFAYVGLVTCSDEEHELAPLNVVGCLISAVGVVYMIMGLCCMKAVSDSTTTCIFRPAFLNPLS